MSLVIPSAFAIALYGESLPLLKILGMIAAIVAIILVNLPKKKSSDEIKVSIDILMLPIITFLLSGVIEIILFYTEASGKLKGDDIQFTATSFGLAGLMGLIYSLKDMVILRKWISLKDVIGGVALGLPNYLTIYLLVFLLAKGWDGSVLFPLNNIGILICTTLVGVFIFREQLDNKKIAGLLIGGVAILLIGMS
jgi:drug/metabolite transporter (DMT)-like permease